MILSSWRFAKHIIIHIQQIPEAMRDVKRAIRLRCDHLQSLHLLSLLLSSQKTYDEALDLIDNTLEEYPDNFRYSLKYHASPVINSTKLVQLEQ